MANAIHIPKSHLIMGLSLPLAVLLGYFLAEPMELGSMAVVLAVLGVLCVPLLMRWYHPLLIFCWNSAIAPIVLPGRTSLWMVLTAVGLSFAVINRAVNPKARFITVPSVTHSLLLLAAVTLVTASLTGGVGFASLGSSQYGGGKYFSLLIGIAGYFALTSRRIPPQRAGLYVACFFLSGVSQAIAGLAVMAGPQFHFLLTIFPPTFVSDQLSAPGSLGGVMIRHGGLGQAASAIIAYWLARYGIRGLLDWNRPWRLLLFLAVFGAGLLGGFRTYLLLFGLTFAGLFCLEGLHRTRYLPMFLGAVLLGGVIILPQANKLPLAAQRTLSLLPGRFDYVALDSATATVGWRLEMWKQVWPEVPKYLFRGKGYTIDPNELFLASHSGGWFDDAGLGGTILSGDYHNGPLSILMPFGIYGMVAFLWVLVAGGRALHRNYKFGNPAYRNYNAFILAAFAARAFFFFVGFGSLHSDIPFFAGLLGLGVALNSALPTEHAQAEQAAVGVDLNTEYIRA